VITVAVRWYLHYGLSYRDVEELLAERGIAVDHVTVYRWVVQRFTPVFADAARPLRHSAGDRWFVDETYVKVAGRWRYLYPAVDQYGQVIDVLLAEQRVGEASGGKRTLPADFRAQKVVLAFGGLPARPDSLFTFSKITLLRCARRMDDLDYRLHVLEIPSSPEVRDE
jgi:hypothetical protein